MDKCGIRIPPLVVRMQVASAKQTNKKKKKLPLGTAHHHRLPLTSEHETRLGETLSQKTAQHNFSPLEPCSFVRPSVRPSGCPSAQSSSVQFSPVQLFSCSVQFSSVGFTSVRYVRFGSVSLFPQYIHYPLIHPHYPLGGTDRHRHRHSQRRRTEERARAKRIIENKGGGGKK